mmetsp:Transcript_40607/g.70008  ORF Transcript_40607/g.70008 Transcript_40607/m.70008 type:complete len:80 (+) Transcript_40607:151-390(+)
MFSSVQCFPPNPGWQFTAIISAKTKKKKMMPAKPEAKSAAQLLLWCISWEGEALFSAVSPFNIVINVIQGHHVSRLEDA